MGPPPRLQRDSLVFISWEPPAGIHQYFSQIRPLPAELAAEWSLGALTAKRESLCSSHLVGHSGSEPVLESLQILEKGRAPPPGLQRVGCLSSTLSPLGSAGPTLSRALETAGCRTCSCACNASHPPTALRTSTFGRPTASHAQPGLPCFAGHGTSALPPFKSKPESRSAACSSPGPLMPCARSWLGPAHRASSPFT